MVFVTLYKLITQTKTLHIAQVEISSDHLLKRAEMEKSIKTGVFIMCKVQKAATNMCWL